MDLTQLSTIEILSLQSEQLQIMQQAEHSLKVINAELQKRIEAYKNNDVKE
jgi:sRNA-binding carbon storage regulator CsrA